MGAPIEFNWNLVVADDSEIKEVGNNKFTTVKSEHIIYPISSEIPLIIKDKGCIGLVRVLSFTISALETIIEFEYYEKFAADDEVGQHYYSMYKHMKNRK